jgi:two-component system invasion response regulator UvrY
MLKVLIADDHVIVRRGLRDILREASEEAIVGEASNGQEALSKALAEDWDVVILDITMPILTGLMVLKTLKQERPDLPVLMLSMYSSQQYVMGSLKAGASGYLNKETAPEELLQAIRTLMNGGRYVSKVLASSLDLDL